MKKISCPHCGANIQSTIRAALKADHHARSSAGGKAIAGQPGRSDIARKAAAARWGRKEEVAA